MDKKIKRFANCIPVKGFNQSVICDLQRSQIKLIPNDLFEIITNYDGYSITEIKKAYENKFDAIIDEYLEFLLIEEFVFLTETPELFPSLNLEWKEPFEISNAIIDINEHSTYDVIEFVSQLETLYCKHIEIRFFNAEPDILITILEKLKVMSSIIHSVDIVVDNKFKDYEFWSDLIHKHPRLQSVVLFNSNVNELIMPVTSTRGSIVSTKQAINSENHCGVISKRNFAVNIKNFTESLQYNSCLNRKISIDVNGNLKNCPSMSKSYGNIKNARLAQVLLNPNFKNNWNITKDQIDVCKDCEFRYICTDCRAYKENPEDDYSKPLKCGYSPYTNEWEEWSTNPLKQKTIKYYDMQELVGKND